MPETSASKKNNDDGGVLLSLPQSDIKSTTKTTKTKIATVISSKATKSDLVLFQLPTTTTNKINKTIIEDLWDGRCQIFANNRSASIVTPSTSLKLVTVGSSNAVVLWKKEQQQQQQQQQGGKINTDDIVESGDKEEEGLVESSPTKKRLKRSCVTIDPISNNTDSKAIITKCRLTQPGGSGSSFLIGQNDDINIHELSQFFIETSKINPNGSIISTKELCNLFQVSPPQIQRAMLRISTIISFVKNTVVKNEGDNSSKDEEEEQEVEYWALVPEEEVLFGQRALVDTLCEEDDIDGDMMTINDMTEKVSQRLLPLLMDLGDAHQSHNSDSATDNKINRTEYRSLAIAHKTLLLASTTTTTTMTSLSWNQKKSINNDHFFFKPDTSKIAFFVLRDLFMKYPSYAWSDLVEKWSARLPLGEQYERITSTTEWIEDKIVGLIPNQLIFSSSSSSVLKNDDNVNDKESETNNNTKGVIQLVNPHSVLIWIG